MPEIYVPRDLYSETTEKRKEKQKNKKRQKSFVSHLNAR